MRQLVASNQYNPRAKRKQAVPPGEILYEYVTSGQLTVQRLAEELGISIFHVLCIFEGRVRITPILAQRLAPITQTSAQTWMHLQQFYDDDIAARWSRRKGNG